MKTFVQEVVELVRDSLDYELRYVKTHSRKSQQTVEILGSLLNVSNRVIDGLATMEVVEEWYEELPEDSVE